MWFDLQSQGTPEVEMQSSLIQDRQGLYLLIQDSRDIAIKQGVQALVRIIAGILAHELYLKAILQGLIIHPQGRMDLQKVIQLLPGLLLPEVVRLREVIALHRDLVRLQEVVHLPEVIARPQGLVAHLPEAVRLPEVIARLQDRAHLPEA